MRRSRKIWIGIGVTLLLAVGIFSAIVFKPRARLSQSISFLRDMSTTDSTYVFEDGDPAAGIEPTVVETDDFIVNGKIKDLTVRLRHDLDLPGEPVYTTSYEDPKKLQYEVSSRKGDEEIGVELYEEAGNQIAITITVTRPIELGDRIRHWWKGLFGPKKPDPVRHYRTISSASS